MQSMDSCKHAKKRGREIKIVLNAEFSVMLGDRTSMLH